MLLSSQQQLNQTSDDFLCMHPVGVLNSSVFRYETFFGWIYNLIPASATRNLLLFHVTGVFTSVVFSLLKSNSGLFSPLVPFICVEVKTVITLGC